MGLLEKYLPDDISSWKKTNPDQFAIFILRIVIGLMWFTQTGIKLMRRSENQYDDFDSFLGNLNYAALTHPISGYSKFIYSMLIPNYKFLLICVIFVELFISLSIIFGVVSRLGATSGCLMTINLWFLTLGWDEWLWTYPLILLPHIVLLIAPSGRIIGIDRYLYKIVKNKVINLMI